MLRFAIRRLLTTIPMVLLILSLTWGLIRMAPGNFYSGERRLPAASWAQAPAGGRRW